MAAWRSWKLPSVFLGLKDNWHFGEQLCSFLKCWTQVTVQPRKRPLRELETCVWTKTCVQLLTALCTEQPSVGTIQSARTAEWAASSVLLPRGHSSLLGAEWWLSDRGQVTESQTNDHRSHDSMWMEHPGKAHWWRQRDRSGRGWSENPPKRWRCPKLGLDDEAQDCGDEKHTGRCT